MDLAMGFIVIVARSITFDKYFLGSSFCSSLHLLRWHLQGVYFAFIAVCSLHPVFEATHHLFARFPIIPVGTEPPEGGRERAIGRALDPGLTDRSTVGMWCSHFGHWEPSGTTSIRILLHGRDGSPQLISQLIFQLMWLTPWEVIESFSCPKQIGRWVTRYSSKPSVL